MSSLFLAAVVFTLVRPNPKAVTSEVLYKLSQNKFDDNIFIQKQQHKI